MRMPRQTRLLPLAVFAGGALGALARVACFHAFAQWVLPWQALLLVNGGGSLALGCLMGWVARHPAWSETHKPLVCLLGVGFCGAFTTFSAVSGQGLRLVLADQPGFALALLTLQTLACTGLAAMGFFLAAVFDKKTSAPKQGFEADE